MAKQETSANFERFWSAYPRREGKAACLKKWDQKKLDSLADSIVAHVTVRAKQDRKWRDGYVPMPLTFINQERWTDEYERISPPPEKIAARAAPVAEPWQQPCGYKASLNMAMFRMIQRAGGIGPEKLKAMLAVRDRIAGEMRAMWGDSPDVTEWRDLEPGYLDMLRAAM